MTGPIYYDVETNSEHAPYADLTLVGWRWESGETETFKAPFGKDQIERMQTVLGDPNLIKIGFNNMNFDNIVLYNHDIPVNPENCEDGYLLAKCVFPAMPTYGLKFLCWWFTGDPHWQEFEYEQAVGPHRKFDGIVVPELERYHEHDFEQHQIVWKAAMEELRNIGNPAVAEAYQIDRHMGVVLEQMVFDGGLHIDVPACEKLIAINQEKARRLTKAVQKLSNGRITNPNSSKQVGAYLAMEEQMDLELTKTGEFALRKEHLEKFRTNSPVARCMFYIRKVNANNKYCENYRDAALGTDAGGWIPTSYSFSRAATGRTTSSSYYKINFQNPNKTAKKLIRIPDGFEGWFIDSTQIENIVHIYESGDEDRRAAYEADPDWSEYVWLCNRILGTNLSKGELDAIPSKQVSNWSVYKQYKTIKLALNFGMGIKLFCKITGIERGVASKLFNTIHEACPAMRSLQDRVASDLRTQGYVQDVFGHLYTGPVERAYKVVAYLIQGCGTGSLPKAQLYANYRTLQGWTEQCREWGLIKSDEFAGVLCGMTHDETFGLLNNKLGREIRKTILSDLMYNMTERFSPKFDNIPLRAKLYLSRTTAAAAKEIDIKKLWE